MTIEQIVAVPADHRLSLELPCSIPAGVEAHIEIHIPSVPALPPSAKIEDVRQLLRKEMTEQGTLEVRAASGEGWETHVREHYAKP